MNNLVNSPITLKNYSDKVKALETLFMSERAIYTEFLNDITKSDLLSNLANEDTLLFEHAIKVVNALSYNVQLQRIDTTIKEVNDMTKCLEALIMGAFTNYNKMASILKTALIGLGNTFILKELKMSEQDLTDVLEDKKPLTFKFVIVVLYFLGYQVQFFDYFNQQTLITNN